MASRSAPYATTNDYSTPSKSVGGKSPSSIAPWDKDQSPKMQSKGGDARKALINSPKLAAAQTAPYSTASNYQEIIPQSVEIKSVSEYAPFGTAENVPIERFDRFQTAKLTAFGTLEEPKKSEEKVYEKAEAPWNRDESKYTHRGKGPNPHVFQAPYATE